MKRFICSLTASAAVAAMAATSAMTAFAEDAPAATTEAASGGGSAGAGLFMTFFLPLGLMFLFLYFIAIKPQKKRDKELKDMQQSLEVGDEIVTGGGIVGIVVRTGEDTVVIETGGERHKLRIKTWAITENVTAAERLKAARAAASSKKAEAAGLASAKLADDEDDEKEPKKKSKKKSAEEE